VDALPPRIKTLAVEEFLRNVVTDLEKGGTSLRKDRRLSEEVIAKTVCRHAIKANDRLNEEEAVRLLVDLLACELPYTCPHGRPTMILLSKAELEKKFGRTG
jgi:DNA mismatch repair protein MutL